MKYLLVLLIVAAAVWWIRHRRRSHPPAPSASSSSTDIVVPCRHCGVHVPEHDAIKGESGAYCSAAHRQAYEG